MGLDGSDAGRRNFEVMVRGKGLATSIELWTQGGQAYSESQL